MHPLKGELVFCFIRKSDLSDFLYLFIFWSVFCARSCTGYPKPLMRSFVIELYQIIVLVLVHIFVVVEAGLTVALHYISAVK